MKIIDAQIHIWSQTVTPPSGLHRKVEKLSACPEQQRERQASPAIKT